MIYQEATCMEELLEQYKDTLEETVNKIRSLEAEIIPFKKIYDDEKLPVKVRLKAEEDVNELLHDHCVYRSIRNELEYVIHWMKTGHRPENKRGIERRAAYQNEKPIDPLLMQRYFRSSQPAFPWDHEQKECVLTRTEKEILQEALSTLTEKELEAYLLFKGNSFSQYKIAEMMNISRNSVKTMISRANKKIHNILNKVQKGA